MRSKTTSAPSTPRVMTVRQVAEMLQVSVDQVYRMDLPRTRIGVGRYRYLEHEVMAWLERGSTWNVRSTKWAA